MNIEQLNAIKERAENATDGRWFTDTHEWPGNENLRYWTNSTALAGDGLCASVTKEDAEFIAHAREDIPQLVAEVERLRKELSFIAHVEKVTNAYDVEHLAVSVRSWALNVLDGVNHDNTVAPWYRKEESE